jgi:maleate isomerase
MTFSSWRGTIGTIHASMRPGNLEEMIRLLPEGIGVLSRYNDIRHGTREEFETAMRAYEENIAILAEQNCDVIHPGGAPPFMVKGRKGEARLIRSWEKTYKTPLFTSGQNQVRALKALHAKSIVGMSYFSGDINETFAAYFRDAGFRVRSMEGIDVPFAKVQELSGEQVYVHIKRSFLRHKGADAIYMLGTGWRTLDIIHILEQDLQVPVVHPVPARVWEYQKRLHVNEPRKGYGILLESMPAMSG